MTTSTNPGPKVRTSESALASRRHAQTRADIHRAAVRLAMEHPVSEITVEQIARASGVSRRTFFNYFAVKNDAFVPAVAQIPREAAQRFGAPAGDTDADSSSKRDLLAAAGDLLRARAKCLEPTLAEHRQLVDVKRNNPELQPLFVKAVREFELALRQLTAHRLALPEDDPHVVAVACLMSSVEKSALDLWLHGPRAGSFEAVLQSVIAGLREVLGLPEEPKPEESNLAGLERADPAEAASQNRSISDDGEDSGGPA